MILARRSILWSIGVKVALLACQARGTGSISRMDRHFKFHAFEALLDEHKTLNLGKRVQFPTEVPFYERVSEWLGSRLQSDI